MKRSFLFLALLGLLGGVGAAQAATNRPNIIFVMADDMGWGQTGYYNHPVLKTPHLDAMAANGLRLDRFYAASVCSPARATVLTGRSNNRSGVLNYGYALRRQEKTLSQALQAAGYATGHFGKWHLNGLSGAGVPILASDAYHPGRFGFDEWLSVSNFYELDPLMSRGGVIEELRGDSSELIVDEALRFIARQRDAGKPVFALIWYGSPHAPYRALPEDRALFPGLEEGSAHHHGELVGMDRSIGALRRGLRELGVADNTLIVFCSDNGGLRGIAPDPVGGLRGLKGSVFEGGIRVPGIIEWPAVIRTPRITNHPASTMDLFPTIVDIVGLPESVMLRPVDGVSLKPLFTREIGPRAKPIAFRYLKRTALVDNRYKLLTDDISGGKFELYDLQADGNETRDLSATQPAVAERMRRELLAWNAGVDASFSGRDYPEGRLTTPDPAPIGWYDAPAYQPYFDAWKERWEYRYIVERRAQSAKKKN